MAAIERRVQELEQKIGYFPTTGRKPSQRLAAERYAILLIKGRAIPKTLQKQVGKLPPEPPPSLAIQQLIDDVMGGNGDGK